MAPEEAIEELQRVAGTQFDPRVVKAFCEVVLESEEALAGSRA